MAVSQFIFGGEGLPKTPQELARLRAVAQAMAPSKAPQNVGEGLSSIGNAIAYRMMMNKAAKGDAMGQNTANSAFSALMNGFGGGSPTMTSNAPSTAPVSSGAPTPTGQPPVPGIQAQQHNSALPQSFLSAVDRTEGAGGYDTLYGHAQRSAFAGTDVSRMPISEVMAFTDPSGAYAQSVKGQIGRVATPVGRYQVVGTTLRKAVGALGLDPSQPFDAATQDRVAQYLATERIKSAGSMPEKISALRSEWHGFKGVPDIEMAQIVADLESGGGAMSAMSAQPGMAATANIPMGGAAQEISGNVPGYVDPMASAPNSRAPVAQALARTQPQQPVEVAGGGGRQGIMAALMAGQPTQDMPADYFPAAPSAPGATSPSRQQIMQVLANQFATPEQKAIASDMYQQMQQSQDPMRQLEMQKMQLELQQMQNPQVDPLKVGQGETIIDPTTGKVLFQADPKPEAKPAAVQEYEYAKQQGFPGTFQDWEASKKGGMSLQVDPATGAVTFQQGNNMKPMTEGQSKDAVYSTRAEGSLPLIDSFGDSLTGLEGTVGGTVGQLPVVGNFAKSEGYQKAEQAGQEFLQAILRKDTGAAITSDEMASYGTVYLPRPGDTPELLEQKKVSRRRALEAIKAGMPPQAILAQEKALAATSQAANPATDETIPPPPPGFEEGWAELWAEMPEEDRRLWRK